MSFYFNRKIVGSIAGVLYIGLLVGCNESEDIAEISVPKDVIIATTASDYSSSAITIAGNTAPFSSANSLFPTISDVDIFTQGNFLYRIERSNRDNIAKYSVSDLKTNSAPLWQFPTRDASENASNIHDMVFASPTKAYLLRYAQKKAWIVDPSATTETKFKTGSLDLSGYADADGNPEMDKGVIVDGKLFVILQRLEYWVPGDAYVAVFDTASDTEVATGNNTAHKGILLPVQDPENIHYNAETGKLYVSAIGSYGDAQTAYSGLVEIDPTSYAVRTILSPSSPVTGSPAYKRISKAVVISSTKGYFTDYAEWKDNTLYTFNPMTGLVDPAPIAGLQGKNLANVAYNPASGLWVGNHTDHAVNIIETSTNTISATVHTVLNPDTIRFVEK